MVKKIITNRQRRLLLIPVVVLRNCEPELSYILAELFNMCMNRSCFPDRWKVSFFWLQLKTITLLVFFLCKVFQKLVSNTVVDHLEKCGLFSNFQYGFRSSRSTAVFLTAVSDRIDGDFTSSGATRAAALDICMVVFFWHGGLLYQLQYYGISVQTFCLISQ